MNFNSIEKSFSIALLKLFRLILNLFCQKNPKQVDCQQNSCRASEFKNISNAIQVNSIKHILVL